MQLPGDSNWHRCCGNREWTAIGRDPNGRLLLRCEGCGGLEWEDSPERVPDEDASELISKWYVPPIGWIRWEDP